MFYNKEYSILLYSQKRVFKLKITRTFKIEFLAKVSIEVKKIFEYLSLLG